MKNNFTLKIYTDNDMKMLNTISSIFTKRNINIESIVTSEVIAEDMIGYKIVIYENKNVVKMLVSKLEKLVKVIKVDIEEEKEITSIISIKSNSGY